MYRSVRGQQALLTLTLHQRGPLAWLTDALFGRLSRKYLAMELEGFRRAAGSAPGASAAPPPPTPLPPA